MRIHWYLFPLFCSRIRQGGRHKCGGRNWLMFGFMCMLLDISLVRTLIQLSHWHFFSEENWTLLPQLHTSLCKLSRDLWEVLFQMVWSTMVLLKHQMIIIPSTPPTLMMTIQVGLYFWSFCSPLCLKLCITHSNNESSSGKSFLRWCNRYVCDCFCGTDREYQWMCIKSGCWNRSTYHS